MKIYKYAMVVCICAVVMVGNSGCGYTTKATLPEGVSTVYVPNFKNVVPEDKRYTYEAGLEIDITNAVIDRLIYDGNLRVVSADVADSILEGEVIGYEQEALRYTGIEGVRQYRLFIITRLTFKRRETGEVIWTENNFIGDTKYYIEGPQSKSERAAADEAIDDLAKKIVDRIVENW